MEDSIEEIKMELLSSNQQQIIQHQTPKPRKKGGLITIPFIIVNESFEKVASYGLMPNMIFYLMNVYHLEAAKGTIIISIWAAISNAMAVFGGFISDSYFGRFRVIAFGTLSSLLGTTLLWLTSMIPALQPSPCEKSNNQGCDTATPLQFLVLYTSFGLISIGAGCVRPCSLAFGADQVNDKENPNNERVLDSFFGWYYASIGLSSIIALTVIVYIQDSFGWQIGFGVPALIMVLSVAAFVLGSPLYVHVKARHNILVTLFQVLVAAYRKRKILLLPDAEVQYFYGNGSAAITPSDNLRCLNKACVIVHSERELNPDGSTSNPWSLCTVERVEILKSLLRIMPMWTTGIMMVVSLNSSYITLQANTMDRHLTSSIEIPAGTFLIFSVVTITLWIAFYDCALVPFMAKYFGMSRGLGPRVRMGLGLLLSCVALSVSGLVESVRRRTAIDEGLEDQPNAVVNMSAMWLVPQLVLLGLAEALNAIGQIEFYYAHLSKTMSSIAMAVFTLGIAVSSLASSLLIKFVDTLSSTGGKVSWLSSNLNKGHVDYYYWLVAVLCLVNFLYFVIICCRVYRPSEESYSHRVRKGSDVGKHDTA